MKVFLRTILVSFAVLAALNDAAAFQYADANAPLSAQSSKYIFYWGQQQCDLIAEQQYQGRITLTPPAFRQMLLTAPKLWNGTGLVADFTFDLQRFKVSSKDYLSLIATLDEQFGQTAAAGQMLSISDLNLGNGAKGGRIDIEIIEPEKEKKPLFGLQGYAPFFNGQLLEAVSWGQEDKFEISSRDFFTVQEFWQILGQQPYVEWKGWLEPQPVFAELQIIDAEEVTVSLRFYLESMEYNHFIEQVRIYQHLIKPGIRATLLLQTSNQYERLYQKSMQLVSDNDERLRLRRNRDFHTVQFQWGTWSENIENLYLKNNADAQNNLQSADQPINRWVFPYGKVDSISIWSNKRPQFWVDNQLIEGASYTIRTNDNTSYRVVNGKFDPVQLQQVFLQDILDKHGWKISDIELPGYSLPSIYLSLRNNIFNRDFLKTQNNLKTLQQNARTVPGYGIKAPLLKQGKWAFEMESPQRTDLLISIFDEKGSNNYWEDIIINAGVSSHSIPANVLPGKGKYYAFLISAIGVTKVEFELL